jgi:predicted ATP-grasp superfamily ATP-dependent carboligase
VAEFQSLCAGAATVHDADCMSKPRQHDRVMIFGASTRAAAQSAVRAGLAPVCADHFADEDLFDLAEVIPLSRYPHGLIEAAAGGPRLPWMYTGALENHPRLLKRLAALRPLLGNAADVVARVRDPIKVARALTEEGIRTLQVWPQSEPPPRDGKWLLKPVRSAGGRGIRVWDDSGAPPSESRREPSYFQERAIGEPHSALYLATSAQTVLIGVSRQLIGESRLNASPFAYCGSIGPVDLGESLHRQIGHCGQVIGSKFGLRGLFGIDFVVEGGEVAWLTEVNPRYTASVEIFESALELPLLGYHVRACADFADAVRSRQIANELRARLEAARRSRGGRTCGKAILYAPFTFRAPKLSELMDLPAFTQNRARIADRPRPGTIVPARAPFCTILIDELKFPPKSSGQRLPAFEVPLSAALARIEPSREA